MRADYDSEANALSIDLLEVDRWDDGDSVDDGETCNVSFTDGHLANVELLYPQDNLELLGKAADRFKLDAEALLAAAKAALAAPDRAVTIQLTDRLADSH
jgi:prepilin-type processing-associated H-X9-DG protein